MGRESSVRVENGKLFLKAMSLNKEDVVKIQFYKHLIKLELYEPNKKVKLTETIVLGVK